MKTRLSTLGLRAVQEALKNEDCRHLVYDFSPLPAGNVCLQQGAGGSYSRKPFIPEKHFRIGVSLLYLCHEFFHKFTPFSFGAIHILGIA